MAQTIQRARRPRREKRAGAVSSIYVKPDTSFLAERADGLEVVEGARGGGSGARYHRHHLPSGVTQLFEVLYQHVGVHPEVARRNSNAAAASHSQLSDR